MNSSALELAFLYEISSLKWPGSEADLFDEVIEKAVRLFGVQRAALVLQDDTGQSNLLYLGLRPEQSKRSQGTARAKPGSGEGLS
ncbi:hypothetical protein SAMN02745218_02463 [Desulfofundulus australicus DSM 11792]|uniref:Uncharacterized protein n=1 Tax=Desulfofundulus australicus DSM 11792 TaxID=1121425 RepID=A0A1M5C9M0_9FIRM|nr:hypothetical protein [Desulfofundulus australicus]SHF51411.1 hypothetical protein SAMN02745218_02463 [Desulfofundulus australicus DSM 11792]